MCKLLHALSDIGVLISGTSFDGDKASVRAFCKEFYEYDGVELNS